jgi:transposase
VGREQQGSLLLWPGWAGQGPQELGRLESRAAQGTSGQVPAEEEEGALPGRLPVYHRAHQGGARSQAHPTPRIGILKTHESTRKLARRLEHGTARILAATITRTADRWFVSFTVEVQRPIPASNGHSRVVGVDVGICHLATLSTGATIPNPRALEHSLRKLRRMNRQLARRKSGSKRRNVTRRRLARVHVRAANLRRDALHKLTTTLATQHGTVVIEQLNMAGMVATATSPESCPIPG